MKHPLDIENYQGTLQDLATELGDLRYDTLAEFLQHFSEKLAHDSEQDQLRGRQQLAQSLVDCSTSLATAQRAIEKAWRISAPYMKDSQ